MDFSFLKVPKELQPNVKELEDFYTKALEGPVPGTEWRDHHIIPGFNAEVIKYVYEEWEDITEGDVFLASYPKTGTHWMGEILARIIERGEGEPKRTAEHTSLTPLLLELGPVSKMPLISYFPLKRRAFSIHMSGNLFNAEKMKRKKAKVIYTMRNPKDQAVSWFHFSSKVPMIQEQDLYPKDWGGFLKQYMAGKHPTMLREGEWYPDHILSWYQYKGDDDFIKFIYYEDLKKDLKSKILEIAAFLSIKLTETDACEICEEVSFGKLRSVMINEENDMAKITKVIDVFRKGEVGNWKNYFTVAQSEAMDEIFEAKLGHTDVKFTYQL